MIEKFSARVVLASAAVVVVVQLIDQPRAREGPGSFGVENEIVVKK